MTRTIATSVCSILYYIAITKTQSLKGNALMCVIYNQDV